MKRFSAIMILLTAISSCVVSVMGLNIKKYSVIQTNNSVFPEYNKILKTDIYARLIPESKNKDKKIKYFNGWLTSNVNIRKYPSENSEILEVLPYASKVKYYKFNNEWCVIEYDGKTAYVNINFISEEKITYRKYAVPNNSGFKSYMPYALNGKSIFKKSSKQYALQQISYTGNYGIRMADGRFCVAVGSYFLDYAGIGTYFDIVLENETVIKCILADVKADKHTDNKNIITVSNGCLTEFVVDSDALNRRARRDGDISSVNKLWDSKVIEIRIYDKNILD